MQAKNAGETQDYLILPGKWEITYHYSAGVVGTRFFRTLRDEARIIATKCPSCGLVMLPPRSYCERCFVSVQDWVEVGNEGTIEAATIVYDRFEGLPEPPYAIAYAVLDRADTGMLNFVDGIDLSDPEAAAQKLRTGAKIKVVFKEERQGRITDFRYHLV